MEVYAVTLEQEVFEQWIKHKILPEIPAAKFRNKDYKINNFGAVSGGKVKNTEEINKLIDLCSSNGGGRVVIPEGIWLSGPIILKDNVNLHLEKGALLIFSSDLEDYGIVKTEYEGMSSIRFQSPISGRGVRNIAITGRGVIDGSGNKWRPVKKFKMTDRQWKELVSSGAVTDDKRIWWPSKKALHGAKLVAQLDQLRREGKEVALEKYREAGEYLRPVLLSLVNCKQVLLDGPTFQNSPGWNIHPLFSEDIIIRNLTIRNPWYAQNGDGLDLDSCKNVLVQDCAFDVGDDAICLKSGKDEEGRLRNRPCEDIYIMDCTVYHGHGGFVIGSEMSSGIQNIFVSGCTFLGTNVGLRFKSTRGRGGIVENIFIDNIRMSEIPTEAVRFNLLYEGKEKRTIEKELVTEETPIFRNIFLKNIDCINAEKAILIKGLPEMPIMNINLEDITITANSGFACFFAKDVKMIKCNIIPSEGPVLQVEDSENIIVGGEVVQVGKRG